jgi:hypothetical protein
MSEKQLGRPSTIVGHVERFLSRVLVTDNLLLTDKGKKWALHAMACGLTAETSRSIERGLDGPIDAPSAAARYLLGQHGLLSPVLSKIRREAATSELNNHAVCSY